MKSGRQYVRSLRTKGAHQLKISVLTIGDELLEGVILNTNAQWLGQELWALGLSLSEHATVPDDVSEIALAVERLSQRNDVCILSGGLGPTTDDVTVEGLAHALKEPIVTDETQFARLRKIGLNHARAQHQARRPNSAQAVDNSKGHAPLIQCHLNACLCVALPGVPREFKSGFSTIVHPALENLNTYTSKSLAFLNLGESRLMETVQALNLSSVIECRYLADPPLTHLRLRTEHDENFIDTVQQITTQLAPHYLPKSGEALMEALHLALSDQNLTIATAESCTSGLIADALANRAGSSRFLLGGIVAYSNEVKLNQLEVNPSTLSQFGAVSETCAQEMALNVCRILEADVGLSVTGIAGPGGGTDDKPVGTVCFGWHLDNQTIVQTVLFRGNRSSIRRASAVWSLHRCLELIRARS